MMIFDSIYESSTSCEVEVDWRRVMCDVISDAITNLSFSSDRLDLIKGSDTKKRKLEVGCLLFVGGGRGSNNGMK